MNPAERIKLIRESASLLAKREWREIDLILGQFGMSTTASSWEEDEHSYVVRMIQYSEGEALRALHQFITGQTELEGVASGPHPWEGDGVRLFMSHRAERQKEVGEVAKTLSFYGIDAFVAHKSIEPSLEWQDVIEAALRSCKAMAVFLHTGFHESDWCDQEVGFAMARGVPVLPLRFDLNPYGFMGKLQAEPCTGLNSYSVALKIVEWVKRTSVLQEALSESLVLALENSKSFDQTIRVLPMLEIRESFEPEQLKRMDEAAKQNTQVRLAFFGGAPDRIRKLVSKHDGSIYALEEPPF
jgi:TIR domain